MSSSPLSKDEWKQRIRPHLSTSLDRASEAIMKTDAVQSWIRRASTNAAGTLGRRRGMHDTMQGYAQMKDDLEAELPLLIEAVEELTHEWGSVDVEWRPMQPTQSRLYIDLDLDYTVTLFTSLSECTVSAAHEVIDTVAAALPDGEPFPNRPNTTTGFVARESDGLGVRLHEHRRDDGSGTYRTVTLLPPTGSPHEHLETNTAANRLLRLLCSG